MDATNDLPEEFDLIVIGTGLTESIFAAAASRIGKNVLHIDSNSSYGASWASYNLEAIEALAQANERVHRIHNLTATNGTIAWDGAINCIIENAESSWHIPANSLELENKTDDEKMHEQEAGHPDEPANIWTKEKVMEKARRFNIDLSPKLLYSRGDLVELLISSNISRYAEFRAVDRVLTKLGDEIKSIPCSRADVFNSKSVSVLEKRLLMKMLTTLMSPDRSGDDANDGSYRTFREYLVAKRLTPNLIHYILYAIGFCDDRTSFAEGAANVRKFLASSGRYGNTPFLYPMYGCGELPQCFCRLCAVFGGTYCLNRTIQAIHFDDTFAEFKSIKCNDQVIRAKHLVVSGCGLNRFAEFFAPAQPADDAPTTKCGKLSRAIYICDKPLCEPDKKGLGGVEFFKVPTVGEVAASSPQNGAYVIQTSHWSGTTPQQLYLIHITCQSQSDTARADIALYEQIVFSSDITILWSMYYNIPSCLTCSESVEYPRNFFATCGPFFELDYDQSVARAKDLFERFYPTEEFLPRAPDPDEIVDDDRDATEPSADLVAELLSRVQTSDDAQPTNETEESMDVEATTE